MISNPLLTSLTLATTMLIGCSQHTTTSPTSRSRLHSQPLAELRPAGDSHVSAKEQRIVDDTRTHLEKSRGKPLDARYRVERTGDGYEVFAMFVAGYENGRPMFYPGGHGTVVLRSDGSFVRYIPGE